MSNSTLTLHVDGTGAVAPVNDLVIDDPDLLTFILSQPDPRAALRDSLLKGVQSLRLAAEPWPNSGAESFRYMGALT